MKCAVTGAAGFIGSTLCERLLTDGHEVLGVDCFTNYYPPELKRANANALERNERFRLVEGDLATMELIPALQGVDAVFHLAAQPGVRASWGKDFSLYAHHGILATQRLLEACREIRPHRVVCASSSSVYGEATSLPVDENAPLRPVSPYGVAKVAAELLCQAYFVNFGIPVVQLRYFTVYGPRQRPDMAFSRFTASALRREPIQVHGDGHQSRDFTFVADAVAATVGAMTMGAAGGVYNIGGGAIWSIRDVLAELERIVGERLTVRYGLPQAGDVRDTSADTSRASADLGFAPSTGIPDGLRLQVKWASSREDPLAGVRRVETP